MKEFSADNGLSVPKGIWYLFYNLMRGIGGMWTSVTSTYWAPKHISDVSGRSPGRLYLDEFLLSQIPTFVHQKEIHMLDIGCGSGYLRDVFEVLGYTGTYTGVDIEKHPKFDITSHGAFQTSFVESPIEKWETTDTFDVICSNTSLEHIDDDTLTVEKCRGWIRDTHTVQIHIVPSFWSLFLYLWHGFRQYTPKRIKGLFSGQPYTVYRLGGVFSFLAHLFLITIPVFFFRKDTLRDSHFYATCIKYCSKLDRVLPVCSPLYVVIIQGEKLP
ncbi:MAG: hypothetical protein UV82_C0001G0048 [Candidatus Magasanikbacteria bacterium GW2011_GWD2_43_18]|uniref:Methyltransferase type 11 domain-containing protein n=1 Tax=Candidatus Magasanikbacteria bacterium GW2011_GWE2_42_7 TaxID=1619052 RepID=A0A0G1ED94_9BACT|nr:MAG: hypothetical protein UV18_C0001G0033 [Candidatus Magasanikbacteria bacterium GW2011_GWC2_42_27]KKS72553.1 MAG: hypothetical protein UV42_C0007G0005 [Candidatus Magasanikbacteria bacterium GW2011_GWE2_42_7]KKT05259.1 MAG: hypothetical protein UV82_C0001G0048 [Candidatus Magasanikbacteria bacterium GW2011_GWD2_43_18]KKT26119.1 MAG: hypothetical protein UW10_C0001G0033 [Candidatus Magasanikbacteria bacterium GW2011_GWA2_43_9]HBB37596.1 hypothetical protein [Candidatus Magasanikbacteria bac